MGVIEMSIRVVDCVLTIALIYLLVNTVDITVHLEPEEKEKK